MNSILDKIAFRFLIGQLLPGSWLILTIHVLWTNESSDSINGFTGLVELYAEALLGISSPLYEIFVFLLLSVFTGILLQGATLLAAANLESFRKDELNAYGIWVPKQEKKIRMRSNLRNKVADLWSKSPIALIFAMAPLILVFDLITILAAQPQMLYKEIYLIRSRNTEADLLTLALSDYQYMSEYFANTAIALLVWLGWFISISGRFEDSSTPLLLGSLTYIAIGFHYILYRSIKCAIDRAVNKTFATGKEFDTKKGEPRNSD